MTIRTFLTALAILATAAAGWSLAQDEEQQQDAQQDAQAQQRAAVRIAHLAVDAPGVRVTIDGESFLDNVGAESVSAYQFVPAGEHEVEIVAARDGDGQQAQDEQDVPRGEIPEGVQQSVQQALDAVEQDPEQAGQAVDDAVGSVEEALGQAGDQARPQLEAIHASLQEARTALDDDEPEVAREALQQTQSLIDEAGQDQQAQQQQDSDALLSETVNFEAGAYYTVLAYAERSEPFELQEQAGQPDGEQPEGEQPEGEQPEQEQQDQQQAQQGAQEMRLTARVIQDELTLPAAGSAMLRVVHLSPDAPTLNLVVAPQQQVDQRQQQQEGQQDPNQQEGQQDQQAVEQEDQQQDAEQQDGQAQAMQQVQQSVRDRLDEARSALDDEDADGARDALDQAEARIDEAAAQADEAQSDALEQVRQDIQEARDALDDEDFEAARQALDRADESMGQVGGAEDQAQQDAEAGQQDDQQAEAERERQPGSLTIRVTPEQAGQPSINVTGPDGFEQDANSGETLEGLQAGTYVVSATLRSYQPAASQVDVGGGEEAEVQLNLQRLATAGPPPIQGRTVISDVTGATASPFQPIPAGTYTAQLRATDQDVTAVELRELNLQPGAAYTVFAYGRLDDDSFAVTITVDALVPQGEQAQQEQQEQQDGQQQDGQQQDGQQQDGQQQEGQQQEGQQDGEPQVMEELRLSVRDALDAVAVQDREQAEAALGDAESQLEQAMGEVAEERQQTLQEAQDRLSEARDALGQDDFQAAEQALRQVQERIQ